MSRPTTIVPVMRTVDRAPRTNYLRDTLVAMWPGLYLPQSPRWNVYPLQILDSGAGLPGPQRQEWLAALEEARMCGAGIHHTLHRLTNNQNGLKALEVGLTTGADWILHLEDDIRTIKDFGRGVTQWLEDHAAPHWEGKPIPFYTFHTPYREVARADAKGETQWAYPVRNFYGNQAWAMPRAHAESAVTFLRERIPQWKSGQGFDLLLKAWATEVLGADYLLASVPCFAQHVGEQSALNNRFHNNQSWPGPDWAYTRKDPHHG